MPRSLFWLLRCQSHQGHLARAGQADLPHHGDEYAFRIAAPPHVHNLGFLRTQAERLDRRFFNVWPRDTKKERALFEKLKEAYVTTRSTTASAPKRLSGSARRSTNSAASSMVCAANGLRNSRSRQKAKLGPPAFWPFRPWSVSRRRFRSWAGVTIRAKFPPSLDEICGLKRQGRSPARADHYMQFYILDRVYA